MALFIILPGTPNLHGYHTGIDITAAFLRNLFQNLGTIDTVVPYLMGFPHSISSVFVHQIITVCIHCQRNRSSNLRLIICTVRSAHTHQYRRIILVKGNCQILRRDQAVQIISGNHKTEVLSIISSTRLIRVSILNSNLIRRYTVHIQKLAVFIQQLQSLSRHISILIQQEKVCIYILINGIAAKRSRFLITILIPILLHPYAIIEAASGQARIIGNHGTYRNTLDIIIMHIEGIIQRPILHFAVYKYRNFLGSHNTVGILNLINQQIVTLQHRDCQFGMFTGSDVLCCTISPVCIPAHQSRNIIIMFSVCC